jgi:hypothetical protein
MCSSLMNFLYLGLTLVLEFKMEASDIRPWILSVSQLADIVSKLLFYRDGLY